MDDASRITAVAEVPSEGTLLFTAQNGDGTEEVLLSRLSDGSVTAFVNSCPHWTDVRLDKGSGALVRNDELVCQKHGATFERDSGYCNFGPCEGAVLNTVDVTTDGDDVFLTDDDYEFEHLGQSGDRDLSSGGRIDF
jgi:nitrite reductase/ring-hydroxylating ferredoxin subunit